MKENYNKKDYDFLERNGRLLFLAFFRPIINGRGFDFKEVQVSEDKRLDVVITFDNKKYIIELKTWHGEAYHREGILQLRSNREIRNNRNRREKNTCCLGLDLVRDIVRRTQIPFIIFNLSFIVYNFKQLKARE